jgi:hypothetical protein
VRPDATPLRNIFPDASPPLSASRGGARTLLRTVNGLSAFTWTDVTLTVGVTVVRSVHFTELRTALSQAYQAAGSAPPTFTDPTMNRAVTVINAIHLNELRNNVRALE